MTTQTVQGTPRQRAGVALPTSSTPTVRAVGRRVRFWAVMGLAAVLVAVGATVLTRGGAAGRPDLGADNPAPGGAMALVEVLRAQGVAVTAAGSLAEVESAMTDAGDGTVFLFDRNGYLSADQLSAVAGLAPRLVVAAPDFNTLRTLAPGVGFGGISRSKALTARCDLPAARRAGSLTPGGSTLRIGDRAADGYTGCFPGGDGRFSVVHRATDRHSITLVAPTSVFSNDSVASFGNAALALNLLGESRTLVWYLPTLADVEATGPPSLGELTPGWVTPVILLFVAVFAAAAFWRGRRFGPLVAENLPVVVKASETMEGRARLYARHSARLRAIDAIRVGATSRLARRMGLPSTAGLEEIVGSAHALTGRPVAEIRAVLVDRVPATDRELLGLSDDVEALERQVVAATHPTAGPPSHERMDS